MERREPSGGWVALAALSGVLVFGCASSEPPEAFWTVIEETRSACITGDSVYEGVKDGVFSVPQAQSRLTEGIASAERASDRIYENEELIPVRSNHDVAPAAVAGRLREMNDYMLEGPFEFAEAHQDLRKLCAALEKAEWEE